MDLGGFPLTLTDTAGLRDAGGSVEREGVRRALARAEVADVVLLLRDLTQPGGSLAVEVPERAKVLRIGTKVDLLDSDAEQIESRFGVDFLVSALTNVGLGRLEASLLRVVEERYGGWEPPLVTRRRQADALQHCLGALDRAAVAGLPIEAAAEELRLAGDALARLTGRIDVEEWLDVIFSEFCIGK